MTSRNDKPQARGLFLKRVSLDVPEEGSLPGCYPFNLPAVQHLGQREFEAQVTVFVGENGMGKSTLLEALAVAARMNPEGGSRSLRFATHETHSDLHSHLRIARGPKLPRDAFFLRAESFYNVATKIDDLGATQHYGGKSLHEQSHGEAFLSLFLHRFGGNSLFLLDEPEAALSPQRQLALLVRMHDLVADGSQFVIATHSPILMGYPGADLWLFGPDGITRTLATETEHWQITQRFLNDPEGRLRELLE